MKTPATADSAKITEIFSSLQGEGPYAGAKHIFLRFEECHMHCGYCDEIHKTGRVWTLEEAFSEIMRLEGESGPHTHVSLTGGEPLLYLPFIKPLIEKLKNAGLPVYLETSGVLWKALEDVAADCAVIAMDLKPASVTHEKEYVNEHRRFLEIAKKYPMFLKMVISKEIRLDEYDALVAMTAETAPGAVLYLQPLTSSSEGHEDIQLMKLLYDLQKRGQARLKDIRIGLRLHRILNIR